jgi:hypothetical protein
LRIFRELAKHAHAFADGHYAHKRAAATMMMSLTLARFMAAITLTPPPRRLVRRLNADRAPRRR